MPSAALFWAKQQFFPDLSQDAYRKLLLRLSGKGEAAGGVTFDPYLAGERTSVEQRRGAFAGLTLATTCAQMLAAIIDALAKESAQRLSLFEQQHDVKINRRVVVSGGKEDRLDKLFHRDWPNIIVADDETISSVDTKWEKLGIGVFIPSPSRKFKGQLYGEEAVVNNQL